MKRLIRYQEPSKWEFIVTLCLGLAALGAVGNLLNATVRLSANADRVAQVLFHQDTAVARRDTPKSGTGLTNVEQSVRLLTPTNKVEAGGGTPARVSKARS